MYAKREAFCGIFKKIEEQEARLNEAANGQRISRMR
jgi:hypothetical protein